MGKSVHDSLEIRSSGTQSSAAFIAMDADGNTLFEIIDNGQITTTSLSGGGTVMVIADNSGILGTQSIPISDGDGIYSGSGSIDNTTTVAIAASRHLIITAPSSASIKIGKNVGAATFNVTGTGSSGASPAILFHGTNDEQIFKQTNGGTTEIGRVATGIQTRIFGGNGQPILRVVSGGTNDAAQIGTDPNGDAYIKLFRINTVETHRVQLATDASTDSWIMGDFGVGTVSPSGKLHVIGTTELNGAVTIPGTNLVKMGTGGTNTKGYFRIENISFSAVDSKILTGYKSNSDTVRWQLDTFLTGTRLFMESNSVARKIYWSTVQNDTSIHTPNLTMGSTSSMPDMLSLVGFNEPGNIVGYSGGSGNEKAVYRLSAESNSGDEGTRGALSLYHGATTTTRAHITSSNINPSYILGNLGIGTASASQKLSVVGSAHITDNIGIGTDSPITLLHAFTTTPTSDIILLEAVTSADTVNFIGYAHRGTQAAPTATQNGDGLAFFGSHSYGIAQTQVAGVGMEATETHGTASYGSKIYFQNTLNGTSGLLTRMTIDHDGQVGIGTENPSYDLHVVGDFNYTGDILANGVTGTSGTFSASSGETVTVTNGIITSII